MAIPTKLKKLKIQLSGFALLKRLYKQRGGILYEKNYSNSVEFSSFHSIFHGILCRTRARTKQKL